MNITGTEKQIRFATSIIDTLSNVTMVDVPDGKGLEVGKAMQENDARTIDLATGIVLKTLAEQGIEAAQTAIEQNDAANIRRIQSVITGEGVIDAGELINEFKNTFYNYTK